MIRYIKLENFKSFENVAIDLCDSKGKTKSLVFIYGNNGSGKSNIISSLMTLREFLLTMSFSEMMQNLIINGRNNVTNINLFKMMKRFVPRSMETIIQESKTVGTQKNMILEIGFYIDGKNGSYKIETDSKQVVHERLEYRLEKNTRELFDLTPNNIKINPLLFSTAEYRKTIKNLCEFYWGKHTFLALIQNEFISKSSEFIKNQINKNLTCVMNFFQSISCRIIGEPDRTVASLPKKMSINFMCGFANENKKEILLKFEKALNDFLRFYCSDIVGVVYHFTPKDNKTYYQLYSKKIIAGEVREIDFNFESSGIRNLLGLLPFIIKACDGGVVAIDEIENSIHELITKKLIFDLQNCISGQLIITTNCVSLLEEHKTIKRLKEKVYIIGQDKYKSKIVRCLNKSENRIFINTNIRLQYLAGKYLGTPEKKENNFDFKTFVEDLKMTIQKQ